MDFQLITYEYIDQFNRIRFLDRSRAFHPKEFYSNINRWERHLRALILCIILSPSIQPPFRRFTPVVSTFSEEQHSYLVIRKPNLLKQQYAVIHCRVIVSDITQKKQK